MRFGVSRKTLMVVAGIVWTVVGVNILRIGIDCWVQVSGGFVLMVAGGGCGVRGVPLYGFQQDVS